MRNQGEGVSTASRNIDVRRCWDPRLVNFSIFYFLSFFNSEPMGLQQKITILIRNMHRDSLVGRRRRTLFLDWSCNSELETVCVVGAAARGRRPGGARRGPGAHPRRVGGAAAAAASIALFVVVCLVRGDPDGLI